MIRRPAAAPAGIAFFWQPAYLDQVFKRSVWAMPTGSSCRLEFVSTDGVPPDARFAFWRDTCLRRIEPYRSAVVDGERFELPALATESASD
jgi:hypothetical protein